LKTENIRIVAYKEIGKVVFIRKLAGRSLKITIKPFKEVQVILPQHVSFETAGRFVEDKMSWIRKQQEKMIRYEKKITLFKEDTVFRTKDHILSIGTHEKSTIQAVIKNRVIRINYPLFADAGDARIQQVIRRAILAALKMEAVKYLPELTNSLAGKFGFGYDQVFCRNNKTRWGSCSRTNRINLNIHLMRLPERLQEYVILHELCHTVHKHHQKSFWQLLNQITGGRARELDKELNGYSPEVF
jgi:predicted metal-dependent hydrolase